MIERIVDLQRYPIHAPDTEAYRELVTHACGEMNDDGALALPGFLTGSAIETLVADARRAQSGSHRMQGYYTAYSDNLNDGVDPTLPADHPNRLRLPASHRFIPDDLIADDSPLRRVYDHRPFVEFLRVVLQIPTIHPIAEPLGRINLLSYGPGDCNGWHFDTNEFIVSLVLQTAEAGGEYHYIPNLRTRDDENIAAVSWRMQNPDAQEGVRRAELEPGSLFLFKGRYTLHRVTEIGGGRDRIVAILSYHQTPGHTLSESSMMAMYGRTE